MNDPDDENFFSELEKVLPVTPEFEGQENEAVAMLLEDIPEQVSCDRTTVEALIRMSFRGGLAAAILRYDMYHWCEVHNREATHINHDGTRECDLLVGGIMMPCKVTQRRRGEGL